jgi:hypothetical protein
VVRPPYCNPYREYRELGKLPRTAPDGLVLQLGGPGQRPWLSMDDRCRPMCRARWGTASENDAARSVPATVTSWAEGLGLSLLTTCLVGKRRRSAAVGTAGRAVVHSLTQPVTCTCSLLIRGAPSKKVSWPEK